MNNKNQITSQEEFFMNIAIEEAQMGDFPLGQLLKKWQDII